MKRYRSTGNWAEDLGHDMGLLFKIGLGAAVAAVVLFVAVIVLSILLIT